MENKSIPVESLVTIKNKIESGVIVSVLFTIDTCDFSKQVLKNAHLIEAENVVILEGSFKKHRCNILCNISGEKINDFLDEKNIKAFPTLVTYENGKEVRQLSSITDICSYKIQEYISEFYYIKDENNELIPHRYIFNDKIRKTLQTTNLIFQKKISKLLTSEKFSIYMSNKKAPICLLNADFLNQFLDSLVISLEYTPPNKLCENMLYKDIEPILDKILDLYQLD